MSFCHRHLASIVTLSVVTFGSGRASAQADGVEFFESKIRPVLAAHCLSCHGPKAQKGGLRLDSREALLRGGESGPVIVEGDPESSLLVDAVASEAEPKMPPKGKLPPDVLDDLKEWVRQGAPWPEGSPTTQEQEKAPAARSWAFRPVQNPPYPLVSDPKWPRTSVDWFVLKGLDGAGLKPSKPADRRTLIRRWSYTLTGLPPSPEEVEAFEHDTSPDAARKVVDRLLASPHYGERWGRHWLDVARYADTKGYVFFEDKDYPWAYTYRDYVVRSLNEDRPYDRFVVEQVAADLLPEGEDKRSLAALGFLTVGGRFMNNVQDILDDRIDVTTRGLMGLTVSCARCHDHKFDPIPTADYYALYGVFASSVEPKVAPMLGPPPGTEEYRRFAAELERREDAFEDFVDATYHRLIDGSKRRAGEYLLAAHAAKDKPKTDEFMLIADGPDLNPAMVARWRAVLDRTRRQHDPVFAPWHALAALRPEDYPAKSGAILDEMARRSEEAKRVNPGPSKASRPGRSPLPTPPLSKGGPGGVSGETARSTPPNPPLVRGGSGGEKRAVESSTEAVNPVLLKALIDAKPRSLNDVADVYERVLNRVESIWVDARSRAKLEGKKPGPLPDEAHEALRKVFHGPDGPPDLPRSAIDELSLFPDRPSQDKYQDLKRAVDTWRATGAGAPPRAMALADLPHPIEPKVFLRGNPNAPGPVVPRRFLSALSEVQSRPFEHGSGRLELAQAIVDRKNPLTPRVLVNRVWMLHFGEPLVDTPGDFGARSDPPSNPELLDHLATAFMSDGWSLKSLHRRIVLSAAFCQASDDRPEARRVDPENRKLWRMNRRRLDWESTRDFLLAASGRLDRTVGGPSVKDGIESSPRRTLYAAIDRLNLPGLYRSFDFPDPSTTAPQRVETSVPPQALFFMNHPLARQSAAGLVAREDVRREATDDGRVERCYRVLFGRMPDARERAAVREFLGANPAEGDWQRLAQALLLCNEFVFID